MGATKPFDFSMGLTFLKITSRGNHRDPLAITKTELASLGLGSGILYFKSSCKWVRHSWRREPLVQVLVSTASSVTEKSEGKKGCNSLRISLAGGQEPFP